MAYNNSCQCCLKRPSDILLVTSKIQFGKPDTYAEMLRECYGIEVLNFAKEGGICGVCIKRLRDAYEFKLQVIMCQNDVQKFLKMLTSDDDTGVKIKSEPDIDMKSFPAEYADSFDGSADHDINFDMSDSDSTIIKHIKKEVILKPPKKASKEKSAGSSREDDGKKCHLLVKTKPRLKWAPRTLLMKQKGTENADLEVKFYTMSVREKVEVNILNILNNTNCTPFLDKVFSGYVCTFCRASFEKLPDLKQHTDSEHIKKNLHIARRFTELGIKVDITELKCTLCDQPSDNLTAVRQHLVEEHSVHFYTDVKNYIQEFKLPSEGVFHCTSCSSKFETFKMLNVHMNGHYRNFVCKICDAGFFNANRYRSHKTVHSTDSFKCSFCSKEFPTRRKRSNHEVLHTGKKKKWTCPHCGLELGTDFYMRNLHLRNEHNIIPVTYQCEICNRSFLLKSRLTGHTKKYHLMERNHVCSECGYSCFSKYNLRVHMLKHNGEKKHKCSVCNKAYGRRSTLREHMRIHNNDRKHKCFVCSSAFVQKCSLKSHMLTKHSMSLQENEMMLKSSPAQ